MDTDSHAYIHQGPIVARVPVTLCKCRVTYDVTFTYYTYIETAWLIPVSNMLIRCMWFINLVIFDNNLY